VLVLVGTTANRQVAQARKAVTLAVHLLDLEGHPWREQEIAVFRGAQEQQPVHQAQQLPEEVHGAQLA
jgi:hypothetical protein